MKILESTLINTPEGERVFLKAGEYVSPMNPEKCKNKKEKQMQQDMNQELLEEFGKTPYEVTKIYKDSLGRILLEIQGKEKVGIDYFVKYVA